MLPYYRFHETLDYESGHYSHISTDSYFFGNYMTALDQWDNRTYASWSFIPSEYYESPYSEFTFFHFAAFVLAISSLVLAVLSLCIKTKRNLCNFSFKLALDSTVLIWMPILFFDSWKRSSQLVLTGVTPSFGFFLSCAAVVSFFFSMRSYTPQPSKRRNAQQPQKLPPSTIALKSGSKKVVKLKATVCVIVLLVGISYVNYAMSVWSTHAITVTGMAYYKMQHRLYDDHPDLYIHVEKESAKLNLIGNVVNPSLCFVKTQNIHIRIYLSNVFFGQFNSSLQQVLEPGGNIALDLEFVLNKNDMSPSQTQLLESINGTSTMLYYMEGTVEASSFVYYSDVQFSHRSIASCWKEG
jgi:hypothetical protein